MNQFVKIDIIYNKIKKLFKKNFINLNNLYFNELKKKYKFNLLKLEILAQKLFIELNTIFN